MSLIMSSSKWPPLMRSEMMMGLEVAPVAPAARFLRTSCGSTLSSQTLVPVAMRDLRDMEGSCGLSGDNGSGARARRKIQNAGLNPLRLAAQDFHHRQLDDSERSRATFSCRVC